MRFKIDENLPIELIDILKSAGYAGMTSFEQELNGKPDSKVINKCREERYILVSLDLDFADIRLYPPEKYAGLIIIRVKNQDRYNVIETFKKIIPNLKHENIKGTLWIVDENRIRIRNNS
jgi:predicted nuclease of predicted toxin-antitoxin system